MKISIAINAEVPAAPLTASLEPESAFPSALGETLGDMIERVVEVELKVEGMVADSVGESGAVIIVESTVVGDSVDIGIM